MNRKQKNIARGKKAVITRVAKFRTFMLIPTAAKKYGFDEMSFRILVNEGAIKSIPTSKGPVVTDRAVEDYILSKTT